MLLLVKAWGRAGLSRAVCALCWGADQGPLLGIPVWELRLLSSKKPLAEAEPISPSPCSALSPPSPLPNLLCLPGRQQNLGLEPSLTCVQTLPSSAEPSCAQDSWTDPFSAHPDLPKLSHSLVQASQYP